VFCRKGKIEIHFLSQDLRVTSSRPIVHGMLGEVVKTTEARAIMGALERNKNNRLTAAHVLGIHKSTLFREIKMVEIDLPDEKRQIR
jgi:transcriptional regulator with PAS, ATPase and Fis domain